MLLSTALLVNCGRKRNRNKKGGVDNEGVGGVPVDGGGVGDGVRGGARQGVERNADDRIVTVNINVNSNEAGRNRANIRSNDCEIVERMEDEIKLESKCSVTTNTECTTTYSTECSTKRDTTYEEHCTTLPTTPACTDNVREICGPTTLHGTRGHPIIHTYGKRSAYHELPPRRVCTLVPDHSTCTGPTHEKICTKKPVLTDIDVCEEVPKISCDQTPVESCRDVPVTVQRKVLEEICL